MARKRTEEIERNYFGLFIKNYPLPKGKIVYRDKPDLIIKDEQSDQIILGIEQTCLYLKPGDLPSSEQRQERLRQEIIKQAENQCKTSHCSYPRLSVSFDKQIPIHSKDKTATALKEFCMTLTAEDCAQIPNNKFKQSLPEVSFIYAQWDVEAPWQVNQVHSTELISQQRLQKIVWEKDDKASDYCKCSDLWLLVVIDFMNPAQNQEIPRENLVISSKYFSKVILYKTILNEIQEINCSVPQSQNSLIKLLKWICTLTRRF